jgi:hypothetical protein
LKLRLKNNSLSFTKKFLGFFKRYDENDIAGQKLVACYIFCALIGVESSKHCKRVVVATCALSRCSFATDEVEIILGFALANLNKKYDYVAGLDSKQRAHVAACHIYIAQAILYDDYAPISAFCQELYKTKDTLPFFERVLDVMETWKNRVQVSGASLLQMSELFVEMKVFRKSLVAAA